MKKLLEGLAQFKRKDFLVHRELFSRLKSKQQPHTLFITCSDSRIDPNLITGSLPGELFIIRNIANMVPPYRKSDEYLATTSAIEYAVLALQVENIIVCGHSNCGGCAAALHQPSHLDELPHTKKWVELARSTSQHVHNHLSATDEDHQKQMMEKFNVIEQVNHLMNYPYIQRLINLNKLHVSGWHYTIETGEISIYDPNTGDFVIPPEMSSKSQNSLSRFVAYYDKLEKQLSRFE